MTRLNDHPKSRSPTSAQDDNGWRLQDAKAQFSEVVRRAQNLGPQRVTVHGREAVVVVAAEEFRRLQGGHTGQSLVDALQASPHPEIALEVPRTAMPVRDVVL